MSVQRREPPIALTIAGTDSGGGAGIAADLATFAEHGVFGTLVVTAVTAQNTKGVTDVAAQSAELVAAQLAAITDDFALAATKTGMLANAAIVEVVVDWARRGALPHLVVDPVMAAASGGRLLDDAGREAYQQLIGVAELVTPNLPEAETLCGGPIANVEDLAAAAVALVAAGAKAALVKGGHLPGREAIDVLYHDGKLREYRAPRLAVTNTHGTGCTLSAAIAARLAQGLSLEDAVDQAKSYVTSAIAASATWQLGHGAGPLDHRLGREGLALF
jgi:hydroxymethylpyrimidine/phosphomethylpyrimidine kinase